MLSYYKVAKYSNVLEIIAKKNMYVQKYSKNEYSMWMGRQKSRGGEGTYKNDILGWGRRPGGGR